MVLLQQDLSALAIDLTIRMMNSLTLFLLGVRDSVSWTWVRELLFSRNEATRKIHPMSQQLLTTLLACLARVGFFIIGLPLLMSLLGLDLIAYILTALYLPVTYGYLFFYNDDIMSRAKAMAKLRQQEKPGTFPSLDKHENISALTSISGNLKSFVFLLLFYCPILILTTLIAQYVPLIGPAVLVLSESFFNGVFYFLKKWPYDEFNIGFIERNWAYLTGFGFLVSVACNLLLPSWLTRGAYLLMSTILLINCVIHSPPNMEINPHEKTAIFYSQEQRSALGNGYNSHRQKLRDSLEYRTEIFNCIKGLKPALKMTNYLNNALASLTAQ